MTGTRTLVGMAIAAVVAGCAMDRPRADPAMPAPRENKCHAERVQQFIGKPAGDATGTALRKASGATAIRWVRPGEMISMLFVFDRLTVRFDPQHTITAISCS